MAEEEAEEWAMGQRLHGGTAEGLTEQAVAQAGGYSSSADPGEMAAAEPQAQVQASAAGLSEEAVAQAGCYAEPELDPAVRERAMAAAEALREAESGP